MTESVFEQPSADQLSGFVIGDPISIDSVVRLLLPQVYRWGIKHYPDIPREEIQSVVNQVFAETCYHHNRYDPKRSMLTTYIIRLVKMRMIDIIKSKEYMRVDIDLSEKVDIHLYNELTDVDSAARIARDTFFQIAEKSLDDLEREFLSLMLQGEKRLFTYLAVMQKFGITSEIPEHPEHEVKNTKERLIRKLKNIANEYGYKFEDLVDV